MKMVMFGSCLVCIYHKAFGYDMIMPLQRPDLYFWCGWLETECLSEFALLFSSGGDPISSTYKLWTPIVRDPSSGVVPQSGELGMTLNSEWGTISAMKWH